MNTPKQVVLIIKVKTNDKIDRTNNKKLKI